MMPKVTLKDSMQLGAVGIITSWVTTLGDSEFQRI